MSTPDFIHPEDAAALKTLKAIPALASVVKAFMNLGAEQLQTGLNLATKIKLSPRQLPKLYNLLPPICKKLDIKEPEFFLEMSPIPNAYAFGETQTAITITSGLVELMTEDELRAVVAHECGHILLQLRKCFKLNCKHKDHYEYFFWRDRFSEFGRIDT